MPSRILPGQRFGRLIALYLSHRRQQGTHTRTYWQCRCDCGTEKAIEVAALLRKGRKATVSCGCHRREISGRLNRTHRMSHTGEHNSWLAAKQRCHNPKHHQWRDYGGRGIRMWDGWIHDFPALLAYIGPKPSPAHSLDRWPNPDGDYEPGNVRWATRVEQRHNRRRQSR